MEKVFNVNPSSIKGLEKKELLKVEGGCILTAIAIGIAGMHLAYQFGKDLAKLSKKYDKK